MRRRQSNLRSMNIYDSLIYTRRKHRKEYQVKVLGECKTTLPNGNTVILEITTDDLSDVAPTTFESKSAFMAFKNGYWVTFDGNDRPPAKSLSKVCKDAFNNGRYIGFLDRFKPNNERWPSLPNNTKIHERKVK
jgi:hypothetical protein